MARARTPLVGEVLRARRLELGLTLRELDALSDVGFASISEIENGHNCTISTLFKLVKALRLELVMVPSR